ncbi:hypothetical protein DJ532_10130 [Sulfolobus sp. A20-N-F8]|nr:hypothetical protein DJ532_10130 [Sulfolobus sp. A20-N-F8]
MAYFLSTIQGRKLPFFIVWNKAEQRGGEGNLHRNCASDFDPTLVSDPFAHRLWIWRKEFCILFTTPP